MTTIRTDIKAVCIRGMKIMAVAGWDIVRRAQWGREVGEMVQPLGRTGCAPA